MRNCVLSVVICQFLFTTSYVMAADETPQSAPEAPTLETTTPAPEATTPVPETTTSVPATVEELRSTPGTEVTVVPPVVVPTATPVAAQVVPPVAEQASPKPVDEAEQKPRHRWVGLQLDLGVPDGAAAGIVVRPYIDWLRVVLSATHNGASSGIRGAVTVDPINFGIAPTLTLGVGHAFKGNVPSFVPSAADIPAFDYTYVNLHPGLEFGSRNSWRFFFQGGPTWMHVNTYDFQKVLGSNEPSLRVADPSANIRFNPTIKLGLTTYF
jgi:hypothetical protein